MKPKFKIGDQVRLKSPKNQSYTMTIIDVVFLNMEHPYYYICERLRDNVPSKDTYAEEKIELSGR